jgi:hypothetical protein
MASIMDDTKPAVNTTEPAAVQETVIPTVQTQEDYEAKIAALDADKAKAIEEAANWKVAALKNKGKLPDTDESEEERIARIVAEKLSTNKVEAIDTEKDALLKKMAKENKELKLANLNKTNMPPASIGSHSEAQPVKDTVITQEQLDAFKKRGWTEKDIERYKKNLGRYGGR